MLDIMIDVDDYGDWYGTLALQVHDSHTVHLSGMHTR